METRDIVYEDLSKIKHGAHYLASDIKKESERQFHEKQRTKQFYEDCIAKLILIVEETIEVIDMWEKKNGVNNEK